MLIDFSALDARTAYFWMASTITPRPVAWVSTCSSEGVHNLAPFSFFQMVTPSPPTLMLSPLLHPDGRMKDTARNIEQTKELVVNLVPFAMVERMNATSFSYGPSESESERCDIATIESTIVKPRRVANVPVSFECRLATLSAYPPAKPSCHIILAQVVDAHIDDTLLDAGGQIDPVKLDLVSRMGADWYGRTNADANFILQRPEGWNRPAPDK